MPRSKRWNTIGLPQLLQLEGHNGTETFRNPRDCRYFVALMAEFAIDYECEVHTFALLPQRVAILCTPQQPSAVSSFVQALGRAYVPRFNRWYSRSGSLWNGRYRAAIVEPGEPLLDAQRYLDTMPARGESPPTGGIGAGWTGYQCTRLAAVRQFIRPHTAYLSLGHDEKSRLVRYGQLRASPLTPELVQDFEQAVYRGLVVGSQEFKDNLARESGRRTSLGRPGRPKIRQYRPIKANDIPPPQATFKSRLLTS